MNTEYAFVTEPTDEELSLMIMKEIMEKVTKKDIERPTKRRRSSDTLDNNDHFLSQEVVPISDQEYEQGNPSFDLERSVKTSPKQLVFIEVVPKRKKRRTNVSGEKTMVACHSNFTKKQKSYDKFMIHLQWE
jgi:hypothetical protein